MSRRLLKVRQHTLCARYKKTADPPRPCPPHLTAHVHSSPQERSKLEKEPLNFVAEIETLHDDIFKWSVTINGPPESPYAGGKFCVRLDFPEQYPFKPPVVSVPSPVLQT